MGSKQGAIKNTLAEHIKNIGNILGTHWELKRNMEGTKEE